MDHVRHVPMSKTGFAGGKAVELLRARLWYADSTTYLETVTPYSSDLVESRTWPVGSAPGRLSTLDEVVARSGDDLYRLVIMYLGIQEHLEGVFLDPTQVPSEGTAPT